MKLKLAVAVCLVSSTFTAFAAFGQSQADMNRSTAQEARLADQALNAQYTATRNQLSAPTRALLRDAQRSWITFRDQECRLLASGVDGGSAYPMVISVCLTRLTTDRTRELRALAECEEGDLACPAQAAPASTNR